MDYIALGKRIRYLRKLRKLTQEQLAEAAGLSISFVGHIERGSRIASLSTIMELANALQTTPDRLLADSLTQASYGLPIRDCLEYLKEIQSNIDLIRDALDLR